VWFFNKAFPGLPKANDIGALACGLSLLDNDPLAVIGHDEAMKIKVEAARRRCLGDKPAGVGER